VSQLHESVKISIEVAHNKQDLPFKLLKHEMIFFVSQQKWKKSLKLRLLNYVNRNITI